MADPVQSFLSELTSRHRVILIGGLAVIAHGRDRHTKDVDIWLEPMDSPSLWAASLEFVAGKFSQASVQRIPGWQLVSGDEIATTAEEIGMVRINGLGQPIDVFRKPNELETDAFEDIASRCRKNADRTLLIDPLDLCVTKFFTNRKSDHEDIAFLEEIARQEYLAKLPTATPEEAAFMLDRYSEWRVLQAALENPSPEVKELANSHLREFADAGDPFSQAILEGRPIPPAP